MNPRVNRLPALLAIVVVGSVTSGPQAGPDTDPVLQVLTSEMERAMGGFAATDYPPYHMAFEVWDRWNAGVSASNGALVVDRTDRNRLLDVDVRVGSRELDNTRPMRGRNRPRLGFNLPARLPIDTGTVALRSAVWSQSERDYRTAVEDFIAIETNQAATAPRADTSPDFSEEGPYVVIEELPSDLNLDQAAWAERVRRLSSRFDNHPVIFNSTVSLSAIREIRYVVTNRGTTTRTGDTQFRLRANASSRADDGMDLSLNRTFFATSPAGLPSEDEIAAAIDTLIQRLEQLREAPVVEPYAGPAILTGEASGVFFHEILGHRLEGHRQKDEQFSQTFTSKVGEQILPPFISVTDDPRRRTYNGVELAGHYRVDDEGVPSARASLVEDGILRGFIMGRSPIEDEPRSNGHGRRQPGRDVVARQGNLLVESQRAMSHSALRERLIDEVERQDKPYGLLFEEIAGGFTFTGRLSPQTFKVIPRTVYRVYPDGRPDELVRGVDIVGTPLTVFSKIVATDDQPRVFNGYCGAESGVVPVSAVSPSILVSEIEIEKKAISMQRLPILAPPSREEMGQAAGPGGDDVVLGALIDELRRAQDSLQLEGLADPYYIAYRVSDGVVLDVEATFGSVTLQNLNRLRFLGTEIRVGSRQFDNSSFFDRSLRSFGTYGPLPLDDAYLAIRKRIWWTTDLAYKLAAQAYARKQSAVEGEAERDTIPDLSDEPVHVDVAAPVSLTVNEDRWSDLVRAVSAAFKQFPAIEDGRVRALVRRRNRYFASTEGSMSRTPDTVAAIALTASARGESGATVQDSRLFAAHAPDRLPDREGLVRAARKLAEEVTALADADPVDEYIGPVLFEGRAAGTFFYALLGQFFNGDPAPTVAAQMRPRSPVRANPLKRRLGRSVLPSGFGVVDDPTLREFAGLPLLGHYSVDHQGIPPQPVTLVENGILKGLLASRTPSETAMRSTGHGRSVSPGAAPTAISGNLIVEADESYTAEQLRRRLLQLAEEVGLEYGVIIRSLSADARFAASAMRVARLRQGDLRIPAPVAAFKLYRDGREEPLANMEFAEVSQRLLRDIVAAGEPITVTHLLYVSPPPSFPGSGSWRDIAVSIVAPALLVEEIELKARTSNEKPPVLSHPNRDGSLQ